MFHYQKYKSTNVQYYQDSLILRNDLLRIPIGKSIYDEDLGIEKENDFYGVFQADKLIGTLSFFEEEPRVAHLTAFAIHQSFQRMGLGKELIKFLVADLHQQGYLKVHVDARAEAKTFYQKCGFSVVEGPILNKKLKIADYKMTLLIKEKIDARRCRS